MPIIYLWNELIKVEVFYVVDHAPALAKIFGETNAGMRRVCGTVGNVCVYLRQGGYVFIDVSHDKAKTRKSKIGTEVAHVTRDSDTTLKVKRSTCRGGG